MYFTYNKRSKNSGIELKHLKSIRYWHRPGGGLVEIIKKMKEKGVTDPTLLSKDYMELYIGSLFAMGLQESENREFWIGKPIEDPPDMAIMTMVSDEKQRIFFHSREIEITRYIPKENSLIKTILNKDKPYPGDYVIVCFLEACGIGYLRKISDQLVKKLRNINHVFLIFHGILLSELKKPLERKEIIGKVSLVQLSPVFSTQVIDISEGLEKWRLDDKKLAYVEGVEVFYGLRKGEVVPPKIVIS